MNKESQNIEWKLIWKDEYLKWICAFANADGGKLIIGVNNDGKVVGLANYQKLLEDLPNKIRDVLGIIVDVNLHSENDKYCIEIDIEAYSTPISYKGHYYYRSGSTLQDLKGPALEKLLLKKMGRKWDGVVAPDFTLADLSTEAIELFREKAIKSKRIPIADINDSDKNLLNSLNLLSGSELKRAAIIAFGKKPEKLITGAYVKIGYFRTDTELLYQDEIHGSLFMQVEKTMDLLLTKYMKANIDYEGLTRTETYDFPEEALREALLNALIHKDYSSGNPIQISVYKDWLMIWNAGDLPKGWTIDTLKKKHISEPPNPDIANAFFRAGYIEIWGRGTINIIEQCKKAGLPEPRFEDKWGGLAVVFKNSTLTKTTQKTTHKTTQKTTQEILNLIEDNRFITTSEMAYLLNRSRSAIAKQIAKLKDDNELKRIGPDKGGYWEIIK